MTAANSLFPAVVQKYYDARNAAKSQSAVAPYIITISDADGHVVFRQKFHEDSPVHGFTIQAEKGRLPVSGTITDATGRMIPV